jgi:PAS fold
LGEIDLKHLSAALESVGIAIGIYDAADRLTIFNGRYAKLRSAIGGDVELGVRWNDLVTASVRSGSIPEARGSEDEWLEWRRRARGAYSIVRKLSDGTSHVVNERRMPDGGIAVVWTDISSLKSEREPPIGKRRFLLRFWASQGLSTRACTALTFAGCYSIGDVRARGLGYFARQENCGPVTLREIDRLVDGWADAHPWWASERQQDCSQPIQYAPERAASSNNEFFLRDARFCGSWVSPNAGQSRISPYHGSCQPGRRTVAFRTVVLAMARLGLSFTHSLRSWGTIVSFCQHRGSWCSNPPLR